MTPCLPTEFDNLGVNKMVKLLKLSSFQILYRSDRISLDIMVVDRQTSIKNIILIFKLIAIAKNNKKQEIVLL